MAMDPLTKMMLFQLGSSLFGTMLGGDDQERQSFGGLARDYLTGGQKKLDAAYGGMTELLSKPIDLPGVGGGLPEFSGGGLPMDIGIMGGGGPSMGLPPSSKPGVNLKTPSSNVTRGDTAQDPALRGGKGRRERGGVGRRDPGGYREEDRLPGIDDMGSIPNESGWGTGLSMEEIMTLLGQIPGGGR